MIPRQPTRIRFCLKTEIFSFDFAYCPHVSGENDHRKRIISKTLASCLHVDGRKRRFSNSMMSYIVYTSYITSLTHGRCAECYLFPSFQRFCLDGGKGFEYTKCRRVFWGKRREKIKKYPDMCGRDLNPSTVSHCVQPPRPSSKLSELTQLGLRQRKEDGKPCMTSVTIVV